MRVLLSFIFLLSCSHQKSLLKPDGVTRIGIKQKVYEKPEFFTPKVDVEAEFKGQTFRAPASVTESSEGLSNRQVYFLSLYHQHQKMSTVLGRENQVSSCPSFHQVLLENEKVKAVKAESYRADFAWEQLKNSPNQFGYFPMLAMPVSNERDLYTSFTENDWKQTEKITQAGLDYFYAQSETEIQTICDQGVSPGYYIFENMVKYFKESGKFASAGEAVRALVKIPVLANMLIIDNMAKQFAMGGASKYDAWLLERSNSTWFLSYMDKIRFQRQKVIASLKGKSKDTVLSLNHSYPSPKSFDNRLLQNK